MKMNENIGSVMSKPDPKPGACNPQITGI